MDPENERRPTPTRTSQSRRDFTLEFLSHVHRRLDTLSGSQEELADARQKLVLQRKDFRDRGGTLLAQRSRTRDAEVTFMDMFRQFFYEHKSRFPAPLTAAFDKVHEEHNKLGTMASDYYQAEEELSGTEWKFQEQEDFFYQFQLQDAFSGDFFENVPSNADAEPQPTESGPGSPTKSDAQLLHALAERDWLWKQFDSLRWQLSHMLDHDTISTLEDPSVTGEDLDFVAISGDLLTQITNCEIKIQHLRDEQMRHELNPLLLRQDSPDVAQYGKAIVSPFDTLSTVYSDGTVPNTLKSLPVRRRVRDWLLDYLKGSALEKARYLSILEQNLDLYHVSDFDLGAWEDLAFYFWDSDISDSLPPLPPADPLPTSRHSSLHLGTDLGSTLSSSRYQRDTILSDEIDIQTKLSSDPNSRFAGLPPVTGFETYPLMINRADVPTVVEPIADISPKVAIEPNLVPVRPSSSMDTRSRTPLAPVSGNRIPFVLTDDTSHLNTISAHQGGDLLEANPHRIDSAQISVTEGRSRNPSFSSTAGGDCQELGLDPIHQTTTNVQGPNFSNNPGLSNLQVAIKDAIDTPLETDQDAVHSKAQYGYATINTIGPEQNSAYQSGVAITAI
jgi:hypothetical protein